MKILKPHLIEEDPEFLERFIQEGRLAVSLHHKNIVRIFDAGKSQDSYYLVMELLEGNDVLQIIKSEGRFSVEKVLEIGCSTADALVDAHEHGVIHRDIKPDNIMITTEGKIKLADLGLAKKLGDEFSSTMVGTTVGTPNYMSPEQAMSSRDADARSDIYSLGATLYHMITGTVPFSGDSCMAVMMKHQNEELQNPQERVPDLPDNICRVIMKMMAKDPDKRYQNCEEVLTALNKIRYAPTESEKTKSTVLKTKKFKKPTKKIEELKAAKEQSKNSKPEKKQKAPIIVAILTVIILVPVLLLILKDPEANNDKTKTSKALKEQITSSESPATQTAAKSSPSTPKVDKTEIATDPISEEPSEKSVNFLNIYEIKNKHKEYASIENNLLNVAPRNKYFYLSSSKVFSNYKLLFEYKFNTHSCTGKIAVLSSKELAYNIMFDNSENSGVITGTVQARIGSSPNWKFKDLFVPNEEFSFEQNEWNRMEIICKGTNIKVIVNGQLVTDIEAEVSAGDIAFLASEKTNITVRRLELFHLK